MTWRQISASICLLVLIFSCVTLTHAREVCGDTYSWKKVTPNDNDLLLVVLRVNSRPVSPSIDLYAYRDTFLLPVAELGNLFSLPWEFDQETERFFSSYDESEFLQCDFDIRFQSHDTSNTAFWATDDYGTYIDVTVLAKLLEGTAEFNFELMQLNFTSSDQKIGLTDTAFINQKTQFVKTVEQDYPIVRDQYHMMSLPLMNYRANLTYDNKRNKVRSTANLNAFMDVAYLSADYRLSINNNNSSQFLRFSRNVLLKDEQHKSMGNLSNIDDQSIKYEFGDITFESDELISGASQGLGFSIYSQAQNQRRNFSNIRIEETVLPGWRGLLFRNGQFIEEQETNDNNQLIFDDIPTFYGINTFEIRLFGPEGQEERRQRIVNVGANQLERGKFDFRLQATDAKQRLLDGYLGPSRKGKQFSANARFGIHDKVSVTADWHRQEKNNDEFEDYASLAIDTGFAGNLLRLRYALQFDGGSAMFMGVNSRINNEVSANLSLIRLNNFESDRFNSNKPLAQEARARVNARVGENKDINLSVAATQRRFADGTRNTSISSNVSHDFMGSTLSNTFDVTDTNNDQVFTHRMFYSQNIKSWRLRHSLAWKPLDGGKIERYSANLRWPQKINLFNESRLSYQTSGQHKFKLSHQLNWRTNYFNLQFGASVNEDGKWTARFGISGDLFVDKNNRSIGISRPRGSRVAQVNAMAYIDRNRNRQFDESDEALKDVVFTGRPDWKTISTNDSGKAQLFTSQRYQKIQIDEDKLPDPFLSTTSGAAIVATHAGGSNNVEFPMIIVNDVEGFIIQKDAESERGIGGIKVRILQKDGSDYFETKTDTDGFFYFPRIPAGEYIVNFDEKQLDERQLHKPQKRTVFIAPDYGDIVQLSPIVLSDNAQFLSLQRKKWLHQTSIPLGAEELFISSKLNLKTHVEEISHHKTSPTMIALHSVSAR